MIKPGNSIAFDKHLRCFVHADCAMMHRAVARRIAAVTQPTHQLALPEGLKESTVNAYASIWQRYIDFASGMSPSVPGRDAPWDARLLWAFMQLRARTCKPQTVVQNLTALAHFSTSSGHVLPTSKFDGNALLHRLISRMKRQLSLNLPIGTHATFTPERCTALGRRTVSLLLSAFQVHGRSEFRALPRGLRHHLFASVMQATAGMRFGHFIYRRYTRDSFLIDATDSSVRLLTDWHRYSGRHRYCLDFPAFPKWNAHMYTIRDTEGTVVDVIPAATLMHWHFEQLEDEAEDVVFAPNGDWPPTREARQAWLRRSILEALPEQEVRARALVEDVTPHSFRSGLAGDLFREGASLWQIASACRWHSMQAVRLYAERPCLSMTRVSMAFRTIDISRWKDRCE